MAIGLVAGLVVVGDLTAKRAQALPDDTYKELQTFANVLAIVQKNYVEPVSTKRLVNGAIIGMLASLDPHSAYLTPDLYRDLEVETRGSFGGLGIEITIKNDVLTVVSPIEGTPADKAGIKSGDEIIKINDDFTKGMTLTDAVKMMRGPKGSKIRLTLHREDIPDLFTVSVARDVIQIQSVKAKELKEGYGYVRISTFQDGTSEDVEKAIDKFAKHGAIRGLVLDLRDNPGGLLNQAVSVSDDFLDGGLIVYTQGRVENQQQKYFSHKKNEFQRLSDGRAGQRRQRERQRNCRRRVAGSAPRDCRRDADLRQGFRADDSAARRRLRAAADHGALLHPQRPLDPGGRNHARRGGRTAEADARRTRGTRIELNEDEIHESDLLHHFQNGQTPADPPKPAADDKVRARRRRTPAKPDTMTSRQERGKPDEKDIQLEKAVSILEHWNKYKVQLALADHSGRDRTDRLGESLSAGGVERPRSRELFRSRIKSMSSRAGDRAADSSSSCRRVIPVTNAARVPWRLWRERAKAPLIW